ncbi:alkylglycerol monooxygenase [Trichonephila clavipes]|nr:alkylglycerol monooxygenase [Trichonephila clavipes]
MRWLLRRQKISLLWLFHEPHHSSEEFNLTVPLRLSVFTSSALWYIPRLGILEYIFVTPSHHRVHHGRNRRCIDKNFGSFFILWDHFFGTFEPEGDMKIAFGVTKPLQTFNPIMVQPKDDEKKYDPLLPGWLELYILFHASAMVIGYLQMILFLSKIPPWITFVNSLFLILTTISIGYLLDLR